ncbi:MAG: hypothetical protein QME81_03695 [bacterium]|nr:hypothetical protein [bacterium]
MGTNKALLFILLVAAVIPGCQENWQNLRTTEDNQYMYFVGMARGADSFEEGTKLATADALANIVTFFGARASKEVEILVTELKTRIKAEIDVTGKQPLLEGLYIDKWKCEEREEERYGKAYRSYDIALRLKYSREAIKKEQERLKQETEEHLKLARRYLAEGKAAEEKGKVLSAFQAYLSSLRSANIGFDQSSRTRALSSIESLIQRIDLQKASEEISRLTVRAALQTEGGKTPIVNLPITFSSGQKVITNQAGMGILEPVQLTGLINVIEAAVDIQEAFSLSLSDLSEKDAKEIQKAIDLLFERKVEFHLTRDLGKIVLSISCESLGEKADRAVMEAKFSSRLVESGQKIVGQSELGESMQAVEELLKEGDFASLQLLADTIITGNFFTRRGAKLENDLFSSFASGSLKVIDLNKQEVIFQKEASDVAGFGLDMESAGTDALNKAASLMADYLCGGER